MHIESPSSGSLVRDSFEELRVIPHLLTHSVLHVVLGIQVDAISVAYCWSFYARSTSGSLPELRVTYRTSNDAH